MNTQRFAAVFPLGSHLCREPMPPMTELKRDMEILKRHGFNLIKLQEHWMLDEPAEGRYDFSRYEELIAHAATLDLGVYLGLTCEQAPHWLYLKHPDCRMVRRDGLPVVYEAATTLPADGKPGPCFDHPGAQADQTRFITRLAQTLGRFENLVIWNTWQEIGYWSDGLIGSHVCYCPHTLAAFHTWLKTVHGDLDRLNRAWNTRYARWEDILPERQTRAAPSAVETSFRSFMDNPQIARVLQTRATAIRAADPLKRPIFAHKGGAALAAGQDWTYARGQDFLGSSCYPAWGRVVFGWDDGSTPPLDCHTALLTEIWDPIAYRFDHIRSANGPGKPLWAAEFQGGPVCTEFHKGRVPTPDDIRRWLLTAVGSGVTALSFWVTRAEIMAAETNGFSLLDSAGDTTPRLAEAGLIGRALQRYPDLFGRPTLAPANIAILVNEQAHQLCGPLGAGGHLAYSTRGWYHLLWEAGIAVDLMESALAAPGDLARYRTLVLPFPLVLSEAVAAKLAAYVEAGGHLVSEAAPGRINEYGFCPRGELSPLMATLCGVRQTAFTMVREPDGGARWSPPERTWGEYLDALTLDGAGPLAGHRLRANVYLQTFEPLDAEPILRAGDQIAGVRRQAGRGWAWLLGTYVGHGATAYRDPAGRAALLALLAACGVTPAHHGRLLLRKRVTAPREAWLFTNPAAEPVMENVSVRGWSRVCDLLDAPLERTADKVPVRVEPLDVRVLIVER